MRIRPAKDSDYPILRRIASQSGLPYPDPSSPQMEAVYVILDEKSRIVMAVGAERIVQLYLWVGWVHSPAAKMEAIKMLQRSAMRCDLQQKGYSEVNAFIPPELAEKFGRRLERTFGWVKNWASWVLKL